MPIFLMDLIEDSNDQELFEKVYTEYQQLLLWQANSLLHDEQKASDALIDTFLKLATIFQKTDKKVCPRMKRFLVIINRNVAVDMLRKESKEIPVSPENVLPMYDTVSNDEPYHKAEVDEAIEMIAKLPAIYRDVLYLFVVEDSSVKDIAVILGISESTAYKRLERARNMLKKEYDND